MKNRFRIAFIVSILLLAITTVFCLQLGSYHMSFTEILGTLFGQGSYMQQTVIFDLRLPRILIAIAVGMAFSTAGCILQSVTKNALADPGIIGINAGASLAVVLLIYSGGTVYYDKIGALNMFLMPFVAIIGAMISAALIYVLSIKKTVSPFRLILNGIGVNAGLSAFITFYQLNMSQGDYNQALVWTSGSLWGSSYSFFFIVAPVTLLLVFVAMYKSKTLDVMDLGDELATGLGIQVEKERRRMLIVAVVISAVATSVAGNISFLGLISPHIARKLVGPVHRRVIPVAAVISMIIILVADGIARTVFAPVELPVGIMISVIGVPYFIYLMLTSKEG
ncbi:MAG: iron ABC transporter permease [bacterium]|nr:iron ABC transporter permease [bacterium]